MASRKKGAAKRVGTVKGSALNRRRGRASTGSDRNLFFRESAKGNAASAGETRSRSKAKALKQASKAESKSGG